MRFLRNKNVKIGLLGLLLIAIGCEKKNDAFDDTYDGSKVMILGHSGMGTSYYKPRNTIESIAPVIGIGADGTEMDIQMTNDSILVLFHDATLNANTNYTGIVNNYNWSELKNCKYIALQNMIFINSLDELFSKIPNLKDLYFSFDCKLYNEVSDQDAFRAQYLRAIKNICEKYKMSDHTFIEGDEALLQLAQQLGMTNKLFLFQTLNTEAIHIAHSNHFAGISTSISSLAYADEAHKQGLLVMAWSPNNYKQNKEAIAQHADIIQTDDPISILKLLNRYNYEYVIP